MTSHPIRPSHPRRPSHPILVPLVGSSFRPPASLLLDHLPVGAELTLTHDETNAYDDRAIFVQVNVLTQVPVPSRPSLEAQLEGYGRTWEDFELDPIVGLGYLAREGNKEIARLAEASSEPITSYAPVWAAVAGHRLSFPIPATLARHAAGRSLVQINPGAGAQPEPQPEPRP